MLGDNTQYDLIKNKLINSAGQGGEQPQRYCQYNLKKFHICNLTISLLGDHLKY